MIPSVCPSESGISIVDIGYLVVFDLGIGGSTAEVDFVYVWNGIVFPVEVKSGHNAHLKSLHQFMLDANHDLAVRIWSGKYSLDIVQTLDGKSFKLINLPFYMIAALPHIIAKFFITEEKLIDNDK